MRVTQIFLLMFMLFFFGCNSEGGSTRAPYLMGQKKHTPVSMSPVISKTEEVIALSAMRARHQEALADIAAKKETRLKQLELEKVKSTNQARQAIIASENQRKITIEKERQKSAIIIAREHATLYQQYLMAGAMLFLLLILFLYLIHRRNQALKLKLHADTLRHKEYLLRSKQQHERITKTLEILADQSTDKTLKKELVTLLKDQEEEHPKLLT